MGSVGSSSRLSEKNMMSGVFRRVYYCVSFKLEIEPRASCVLDTAQLLYQMNESSCSCLLIRTEAMPYRCFWQGNICLTIVWSYAALVKIILCPLLSGIGTLGSIVVYCGFFFIVNYVINTFWFSLLVFTHTLSPLGLWTPVLTGSEPMLHTFFFFACRHQRMWGIWHLPPELPK